MLTEEHDPPEIRERLRAINAGFGARLPEKIAAIAQAWADCLEAPQDRAHWQALQRLLHSLAGAAGSFGFHAVGERARGLERRVDAILAAELTDDRDARSDLDDAVNGFARWVLDGAGAPSHA